MRCDHCILHCCFCLIVSHLIKLSFRCICRRSSGVTTKPTAHSDLSKAAIEKYWTERNMWGGGSEAGARPRRWREDTQRKMSLYHWRPLFKLKVQFVDSTGKGVKIHSHLHWGDILSVLLLPYLYFGSAPGWDVHIFVSPWSVASPTNRTSHHALCLPPNTRHNSWLFALLWWPFRLATLSCPSRYMLQPDSISVQHYFRDSLLCSQGKR